jgi:hypothetical protein
LGRPVPLVKIIRFVICPNHPYIHRRLVPDEGRFAIVTNVGNGMRWTQLALLTNGA